MGRDTSFFDTIKEQIDLEDYLGKHLGVELVPEGAGRMAAVCPFHDEDTPSFKVTESNDGPWKRWWCFGSCQEGGSVIDAAIKAENFDTAHEAARYLNELYGLGLEIDNEAYQRFARTVQETKQDIDRTRSEIEDDSSASKAAKAYLENRGFTEETIEFFQLGVDTSRTKAGRLSIPLIDKANHPVSIANRALFDRFRCRNCREWVAAKDMVKQRHQYNKAKEKGEKVSEESWKSCPHCEAPDSKAKVAWLVSQNPKYLFVRDFDKANFLYNEHGTRQSLSRDETVLGLYLVEGYADVWAGWQSGQKAICSYNGAELSDWQAKEAIELVERAGKPIILVPDMDETGQGRISKNVQKLRELKEDIEIQIVYGIDRLTYDEDDERKKCKDLGDVLKWHGEEKVHEVLEKQCWQASEWQIREIVEAVNPRTGGSFYSMSEQLQLCAQVLSSERSKVALDHLIPYLSERWDRKEEIVRTWFYSNLSEDNSTSFQHLFKDINQAREEAREFLQDDNVIPIGFDDLDSCMPGDGARPGQLAMFLGKALSLDSKILTTSGWKRMGDMRVGDTVVDPDGGSGSVTGVFPQGERELYKLVFSDGASVECDKEHLWHTSDYRGREKVQTLGDIMASGKIGRKEQYHQVYIPVTEPVDFALTEPLPIDPYVLGAILGDGSLRSERMASFTAADQEIVSAVSDRLPEPVRLNKENGSDLQYNLSCAVEARPCTNPLTRALRSLSLLGLRSHEKFIPEQYLGASAADRLQLLRGLMDTDGSAMSQTRKAADIPRALSDSVSCGNEFCSVSKRLAEGVAYLVRSLGGTAKIAESKSSYIDKSGNRIPCKNRYRVRVTMRPGMNPYNTSSKADLWDRKYMPRRRIVSVEPVGSKPAQCITVDTKRSLYITDDFIVTHNSGTGKTMLASQILAHMADQGIRSIIFSLEQAAKSLFPRLVCQALDISMQDAEDLIAREDEEAEEMLAPVRKLYENMLIIDNVPGEGEAEALRMTPARIQAIIQEANMTHFKGKPASVVAIDHLGILEVDDDAPAEIKGSENMRPGYIMQRLFAVCKTTSVFMMVLQQLPKEVEPGVAFGYDAGRGGSQQTDFCDYIFQIWRPEQRSDLDDTERAQYSGQYKLALGKNRYGRSAVAHLMFDKSSLRIMPVLEVVQPDIQNAEAVVPMEELGEGHKPAETEEGGAEKSQDELPDAATEAGAKALEEASPDSVPQDTDALLRSLGDEEDDEEVEELGDPSLRDWFTQ